MQEGTHRDVVSGLETHSVPHSDAQLPCRVKELAHVRQQQGAVAVPHVLNIDVDACAVAKSNPKSQNDRRSRYPQ